MQNKAHLSITETVIATSIRFKSIANRFVFNPSGVTGSKFRILRMIFCDGKQRPSEITKFAGGTKSNVSQRINALEDEGLVVRLRAVKGADRRNVLVDITPKGRALVTNLMAKFSKSMQTLEKEFSEKEINDHFAFFEKMNRLLDENDKKIPELLKK
jgi:DNA-binding MarR family transcriptional regulator